MQRVGDFHYELPEELIAQAPLPERAGARMLVINRSEGRFHDDLFTSLPRSLRAGDCLVLNDTKVLRARFHGVRNGPGGAIVELFLVRQAGDGGKLWHVLARPAKRVRSGDRILISPELQAEVLAESDGGERLVRFEATGDSLDAAMERAGEIPLPPYIHREAAAEDDSRYQTVFARERGSVAAPTAGLHFTPEVLQECRSAGAQTATVTLHVGLGTFKTIDGATALDQVRLHSERFSITPAAMAQIESAERRVCVGTTSMRALESALASGAREGETSLFISPGYQFRGANALLTNFHLPASSLLILVCAFAGTDLTMAAYQHAVRERYRFFSYGDCMLIL